MLKLQFINTIQTIRVLCLSYFIGIILIQQSCITIPNQHSGLPPGIWRGVLYIQEYNDIIVTEGRNELVTRDVDYESKSKFIPFNFEIRYDAAGSAQMTIHNSSEQIQFKDIKIGKDRRTGDDTFRIDLLPYDACLKGVFEEDKMRGYYVVMDKTDYFMTFEARYGQAHRFSKIPSPGDHQVNGNYQTVFSDTSQNPYSAIGEFRQTGQRLEGTFLTETGDYRFLDGQISGDRLSLSCFDGAHAYLFEAKVRNDSLVNGIFYSGKHYKTTWKAFKVEHGVLNNPNSMTTMVSSEPMHFLFETPESKIIDFENAEYKNKVKIIQILGSWCPNCRDESVFLNQYLNEHPNPELVVIGLAFERYPDRLKAMEQIQRYKNTLNLKYEIAYGGKSNKDSASAALPQLSGIKAYPTTLFVDRNNQVRKIHSGFNGPATSLFEKDKQEFHNTVQQLLNIK